MGECDFLASWQIYFARACVKQNEKLCKCNLQWKIELHHTILLFSFEQLIQMNYVC